MPSINDYFTPESTNEEDAVSMLAGPGESRKLFYLTNASGDKLLKLSIKSESHTSQRQPHAQIKIIGYGIRFARVWADKPKDPKKLRLPESVEMTYHGDQKSGKTSKVHLKATSGYQTLINDSLALPATTEMPVPLFALECGNKNQQKRCNPVTKKAHVISTENPGFVRVDFYLASAKMDVGAFFSSMYFLSFFFNQDYLATIKNHPLSGGQIIAPIELLRMGDYLLIVRRSLSQHRGRPHFCFYSNKDYYTKLMNRPVAWKNKTGGMVWSTMAEEDRRLRDERNTHQQKS